MKVDLLPQLRALWLTPSAVTPTTTPSEAAQPANRASTVATTATPQPDLQARLQAAWPKPVIKKDSTNGVIIATASAPSKAPSTPKLAASSSLPVFIDVETQSTCDITVAGGRRYAYDPSTNLISVVAIIDKLAVVWTPNRELPIDADVLWPAQITPQLPLRIFTGPDIPDVLAEAIRAGRPLCAHNALGFDAHVWRAKGLPEPHDWVDTLPMARAAGLPGALDGLGLRLFDVGKDAAGKKTLHAVVKPDQDGRLPAITPEQLAQLVRYNIQDVALLVGVHAVVNVCGEPDVIQADATINERGVAFDRELATKLIGLEAAAVEPICLAMESATGGAVQRTDLNRVKYLCDWLAGQGAVLDNLQRETVENFLAADRGVTPEVRAVLEARLANSRVTTSKLETAIETCGDDGRLRNQLVYYGAHTGRWTSRGVQVHNLPRPNNALKDVSRLLPHVGSLEAFTGALPPGVSIADGLSALIRPCFVARPGHVFAIADFAGIEARGLAWCADDRHQLSLFADGVDSYCELANQIFGYEVTPALKRERAVGKVAVLGCGYGMGADTFAKKCVKERVDLAAANTSAEIVVEAYRDAYPKIAGVKSSKGWREGGLWKDVERAARSAINGRSPVFACKCRFHREGGDLVVELPSGRRMYYRNARLARQREREDNDADIGFGGTEIVFDGPRATNVGTYGGKLTENIVQAVCCDLLAASLLQCEREGLPVVLHVHDEIVIEVRVDQAEDALRRLLVIMSTPPTWAAGFPIEVEGFTAQRYFKTPPAGTKRLRARRGEILSC